MGKLSVTNQVRKEKEEMGTNYYARINPCPTCGRSREQVHIGKSSVGWTFTFHALEGWETDDNININSYKGWKDFLKRKDVQIFDEYGQKMSLRDFKYMVGIKKDEKFNHTIYCRKHEPDFAKNNCFLDPEGHSFSRGEFS